eukprot:g6699.t1
MNASLLRDDQREELTRLFNKFDTNGNGRIEIHELAKIMLCFEKNLTEAELQEMIKEVDTDKSGSLDLVEFLNLMTSSRGVGSSKESKAEFVKAFDDLDVDKDGVISFKDLKESVKHLDSTLSDVEIMEMYREISNKNKDGITRESFLEAVGI